MFQADPLNNWFNRRNQWSFRRRACDEPPRGPWYPQKWSERCVRTDGKGAGCGSTSQFRPSSHRSGERCSRTCSDDQSEWSRPFQSGDHQSRWFHQCNLFHNSSSGKSLPFFCMHSRNFRRTLEQGRRARADEHLTLTTLLSVGNGFQSVSKNVHQHGDSTTNN